MALTKSFFTRGIEVESKNIYQRVNAVLEEGKALEKNGKMEGGKSGNYSFHKTDDVLAMLRPLLVSHGIHFGYTVKDHTLEVAMIDGKYGKRTERQTVKKICCVLVNVDDPNDKITGIEYGYGLDGQDKGPGKATSYAIKTWLLNTFKLRGQPDEDKGIDKVTNEIIDQETANEILEMCTKTKTDPKVVARYAQAANVASITLGKSAAVFKMLNVKMARQKSAESVEQQIPKKKRGS